jgi:hypothetical protein
MRKRKFLGFSKHDVKNSTKHYRIKLPIRKIVEGYKNSLGDEMGDVHNLMSIENEPWVEEINHQLQNDGYNIKLDKSSLLKIIFHPDFQRNYVVDGEKYYDWRCELLDSAFSHEPINPISLGIVINENGDAVLGCWVVIDGQQRLITICDFIAYCDKVFYDAYFDGNFHENCKFSDLPKDYQELLLSYEFDINICVGTEEAIHRYFEKINKPTFVLNNMELLCSVFTNAFVEDAKHKFSIPSSTVAKRGRFLADNSQYCVANYGHDVGLNQEDKGIERLQSLRKALSWVSYLESTSLNGEDVTSKLSEMSLIKIYLSNHKRDNDAAHLIETTEKIIDFFNDICCHGKVEKKKSPIFKKFDNKIGFEKFYVKYNKIQFTEEQKDSISRKAWKLINDPAAASGWHDKAYIFEWAVIDELYGSKESENYVKSKNALKPFTADTKNRVYSKCGGRCPIDGKIYDENTMEYHHVISRFCGGTSEEENCFPMPRFMHTEFHASGGCINGVRYSPKDLLRLKNETVNIELENKG